MNSEPEARASVSRSPQEIGDELRALLDAGGKIVSFLSGGELLFESRLQKVDPALQYIVLQSSSSEAANEALLAMRRCIFSSSLGGWRIEFVATAPALFPGPPSGAGTSCIQFEFPEVLTRWRRAHARAAVSPGVPLQCVADSEGVMPFEGLVVDIGPQGLGFLIHSEAITLEPGTVLKSCMIEIPGRAACKVDLEVCYSQPIVLGDGTHSLRSGCRFIDRSGSVRELVRFYLGNPPAQG